MTMYRAHISWLEGTTLRTVTGHDEIDFEEVVARTGTAGTAVQQQLMLRVQTESGAIYAIRGDLLTSVRYQPVEVATTHRPGTVATLRGQCCMEGSPCRDGAGTAGIAPTATEEPQCCSDNCVCDTVDNPPAAGCSPQVEPGYVSRAAREQAEQEARHPGLGRLLNALAEQLPPDDPDRCAETLSAMDAAAQLASSEYVSPFKRVGHDGPHFPMVFDQPEPARNGARDCPCWPGQCTCDATTEAQPEHGGRE